MHPSTSSLTGGPAGSDYTTIGGPRFLSNHAPNCSRQVISSPLAKLSMSSTLEEGGSGMGGVGSRWLGKTHARETWMEGSREESVMESEGQSVEDGVESGSREKPVQT